MPSKRKNKRAKREQRRARHNQNNKKEGAIMTETENISVTEDVTKETEDTKAEEVAVTMPEEAAEDKTAEVVAIEAVETEAAKPEEAVSVPECNCKEDNEVENKKPENVTTITTKEASHKLYIQYNDLEFSDELMFEAAVNAYCNEYGQDKSSVEAVNLYVKPQEGKAYYVINNDAEKTGSIDL